jgi:hypothetical protein
MSTSIIRCLFGDPFCKLYWSTKRHNGKQNPLGKDILEDGRKPWELEEINYFVMGNKNAELMHKMGAKKIHIVSEKDNLVPNPLVNPLYNKVYLINEAMQKFDEILFLDFDIISLRNPDEKMWGILRKPSKRFDSILKAPVIQTRFASLEEKKNGGYRDKTKDDINLLLNTCLLYCNDKKWVQSWLDHFLLYQQNIKLDLTKHDEYILMYFIDKEKGVMNKKEIIENFDIEIVRTHKEIVRKSRRNLYFKHKRQDH